MRRIALLALVAVAALVIPASSAFAVVGTQLFTGSASPTKAGTKKKPKAVTLKIRPYFDYTAPAEQTKIKADPFATKTANVFFPKNAVFNGKFFPSCARPKVLSAVASCPKGSQVGSGTAAGFALGLLEKLTVKIFNAPGGKGVNLLVEGSSPLVIKDVIEGKLTKQSGKYGYKLAVTVPEGLQQPAPGAIATLVDFDTKLPAKTIKKGKKKIPYVASKGCTGGSWAWGYTGDYTDGTSQTVETTQKCSK